MPKKIPARVRARRQRRRVAVKHRKASKTTQPRSEKVDRPSGTLPECTDERAASQRFVNDLLIRGEAARRDKKGKVPQHATHAIKREKSDGSVEVERVRFKTF